MLSARWLADRTTGLAVTLRSTMGGPGEIRIASAVRSRAGPCYIAGMTHTIQVA
jgi:hypothetical protein